MKSTVTLREGMTFDVAIDDHRFTIDAKPEHGGRDQGPSPKPLLLSALAGCAAMDVIAILRKMRVPPDAFSVSAETTLTDDHPKVFREMTVTVSVTGAVPSKKLWKAVALSPPTRILRNEKIRKAA